MAEGGLQLPRQESDPFRKGSASARLSRSLLATCLAVPPAAEPKGCTVVVWLVPPGMLGEGPRRSCPGWPSSFSLLEVKPQQMSQMWSLYQQRFPFSLSYVLTSQKSAGLGETALAGLVSSQGWEREHAFLHLSHTQPGFSPALNHPRGRQLETTPISQSPLGLFAQVNPKLFTRPCLAFPEESPIKALA